MLCEEFTGEWPYVSPEGHQGLARTGLPEISRYILTLPRPGCFVPLVIPRVAWDIRLLDIIRTTSSWPRQRHQHDVLPIRPTLQSVTTIFACFWHPDLPQTKTSKSHPVNSNPQLQVLKSQGCGKPSSDRKGPSLRTKSAAVNVCNL